MLYQGQVFGAHGAVNATYAMTFRLYDAAEEGDALWTESFENVPVVDGVFLVELGAGVSLADIAERGGPLYLGISLGENPEMQPRMLVGTALRAQWAAHAKDVAGEIIHPQAVVVGGRTVIDETGTWQGGLGSGVEVSGASGPMGPMGPAGKDFQVDLDSDGDGFVDWLEVLAQSDP